MAINIINEDGPKSWLSVNFNELNSKTTNMETGSSLIVPINAVVSLNGSVGSVGEIIKKDASNIPSWVAGSQAFGGTIDFESDYETVDYTTTSVIDVDLPTFSTISLPAGTYVLQYCIEGKNASSEYYISLYDTTGVASLISSWEKPTANYFAVSSGFHVFVSAGGIHDFTFRTRVGAGAGTNTLRRMRYVLYRSL